MCHSLYFDIHVFRFLSRFLPCHLVHSSHLFSVPQLHIITNHFPTAYSFLVPLTQPFMPQFLSCKVRFCHHSQSVIVHSLVNHSLVCYSNHSLVLFLVISRNSLRILIIRLSRAFCFCLWNKPFDF